MNRRNLAFLTGVSALAAMPACAGSLSLSFTGVLPTPEDSFEQSFAVSGFSSIAIMTWSFGGGTNAAGTPIAAGGFDPLVALFSGPVATASILTSGSDPVADADTLSSFNGNCPPAGMVTIGAGSGSSVCGDDRMFANLSAGIYTLVLTDANYFPMAVNPGPPGSTQLSDGFNDFTGGSFQTCNTTSTGTTCITPSNNFAVDIVVLQGAPLNTVPEPGSPALMGFGLAALAFGARNCFRSKELKED